MSRYTSPAMCVAAMEEITHERFRRHERDTLEVASAGDTLPADAMATGRACAAQFNVQTVPAPQLYSLMKLFIMVRDSAKIQAVVDRRAALATSAPAKGDVFLSAVDELLDAHPIMMPQAQAMMTRLDALGRDARVQRLQGTAHLYGRAWMQFDTTAMNRYAAALHTISAELTPTERDDYEEQFVASLNALNVTWYRGDSTLMTVTRATLDSMRTAMATFRNGRQPVRPAEEQMYLGFSKKVGQPADSITGKFWFNAGNTHIRPRPGRVTLVMMGQKGNGTMSSYLAMLRRLVNRYSAQGLDVVLVAKTDGYSWASPPQTPEAEANTDAWYFLNYLKLPVTLVVDETPFTRDDVGRRQDQLIDFQKHYPLNWGLVGRDGRIRSLSAGLFNDKMMEALVRKALADSTSVGRM
jgi:hypothetical protein